MSLDARISVTLPAHPKTKKLIRRLGPSGAWSLVCLFLWAAANRSDGDLSGLDDDDLEIAADWTGANGEFVLALAAVGFFDGTPKCYTIHDWAEHNPWAAGRIDRSEAAKWAALCRRYGQKGAAARMPNYADRMRPAAEKPADRRDDPATRTEKACGSSAPIPLPSPTPSPETESASPTENTKPPEIPESVVATPDGGPAPKPGKPKAPRKPRTVRTRLAADWTPTPTQRSYAHVTGLQDPKIDFIAVGFLRYWTGPDAAGGGLKADWDRTWQNWIDREIANGALRSNGRVGSAGHRPEPDSGLANFLRRNLGADGEPAVPAGGGGEPEFPGVAVAGARLRPGPIRGFDPGETILEPDSETGTYHAARNPPGDHQGEN